MILSRYFRKKRKNLLVGKLIYLKQFIRGIRFFEVTFEPNYSILKCFNMSSVNELKILAGQ